VSDKRYTVISADCHAGADLLDYKPYLEKRYHDESDVWAATYVNPYEDLLADTADRNWNSGRRLGSLAELAEPLDEPPPDTTSPVFARRAKVRAW
jgi:hypothetical protein